MPTSAQLIQTLQTVIAADVQNPQSIIRFFTGANLHGGWEGWLQCVYAKGVAQLGDTNDFRREVTYPGTHQRVDVWFQPARGAEIWVELKTQRYGGYANTVADFSDDVFKIRELPRDFLRTNVNLATATLVLSAADRISLSEIRNRGPGGALHYFTLAADYTWHDVTATILTAPVGFYLLAVWLAPS
jgi:hypothetical protein